MGTLAGLLKMILSLLLASAGVDAPAPVAVSETRREAMILLDRQVVLFTQDGRESNLAHVSTGRPGHRTPEGVFSVQYRRRAPISSRYLVRMPYWICIVPTGEIGFHQAPGAGDLRRLGEPVSHGCIRLGATTARWAYRWLTDGSRVEIRR
ncbi:MAG TPA: L,D-transpeptidase [Candidatus Fermentibacter daniensis]|nr:L,D-transpeptidase [Candidatus Fermentibacter daniensis]